MTRDEAIERMEMLRQRYEGALLTTQAIDMAIEALTYQNPPKPNNTCEVDLISREDATGAVQDHFNADGFRGYYDGQKMMDRITALPSAEADWIPCSERLPEEGQKCLVCDKGQIFTDTFIGHGNPYNWRWYVRDCEAWMPLPKPYKGGDEK